MNYPLKWRKDLRTGVRTAWFADGDKGRYQILRVAEGSWVLHLPDGARTATTDSSTKFIGAAKAGTTVTGESVALHRGRTTMVWQTSIRTADGKLCAVVTQTQLVMTQA